MQTLIDGIQRFRSNVYPKMEATFRELASGQVPETLLITCSDSRIDPNLITSTRPGELFVIRNAGNIVPRPGSGELGMEATIQYAVDVLKVRQIVVCGHSHCGAIQGLLDPDSLQALPAVKQWVANSLPIVEQLDKDDQDRVGTAIKANVLLQLEHLSDYECVALAIDGGQLTLLGWVYYLETGEVEWLDASGPSLRESAA